MGITDFIFLVKEIGFPAVKELMRIWTMKRDPTPEEWDVIFKLAAKTPQQYLDEAKG